MKFQKEGGNHVRQKNPESTDMIPRARELMRLHDQSRESSGQRCQRKARSRPRELLMETPGQAQHCLPGLSPLSQLCPVPSPLRSSPSVTGLTGRAVTVAGGQRTVAASPSLPQGLLEGRRRVPRPHQLGVFRGSPEFSFSMGPLHTAAPLQGVSFLLIKHTPLCEGSLIPLHPPGSSPLFPHLSAQPPSSYIHPLPPPRSRHGS